MKSINCINYFKNNHEPCPEDILHCTVPDEDEANVVYVLDVLLYQDFYYQHTRLQDQSKPNKQTQNLNFLIPLYL